MSLERLLANLSDTSIARNVMLQDGLVADWVAHAPKKRFFHKAKLYIFLRTSSLTQEKFKQLTNSCSEYARSLGYWNLSGVTLVPIISAERADDKTLVNLGGGVMGAHINHRVGIDEVPIVISGGRACFIKPSYLDLDMFFWYPIIRHRILAHTGLNQTYAVYVPSTLSALGLGARERRTSV